MGKLWISKIWARGFRSMHEFSLDLGPLTVLVGRNGSGKSNILDILRFISDAFYAGVPTAINLRGGTSELLNVTGGQRVTQFTVGLEATKDSFTAEYELTVQMLARNRVSVRQERIWLKTGGRVNEIVINNGRVIGLELNPEMRRAMNRIRERAIIRNRDQASSGPVYTPMLSLIGDQPTFAGLITSWLFPRANPEQREEIADNLLELSFALGEMRFYRISPDDIREPQPIRIMDSLEEDGSNFASVLRDLGRRDKSSVNRINQALGRIVPGISGVRVKVVGGAQIVSLDHFDPESPDTQWNLGIAQESDGTVRSLALLVALYQNPAPSLMAIEEPELGIHTGALKIFAELLEYSSNNAQVVVTTHSSDLLDFLAPTYMDSIKAVAMINGATVAGPVATHQMKAIKEDLFTAGYINRIQGLDLEGRND